MWQSRSQRDDSTDLGSFRWLSLAQGSGEDVGVMATDAVDRPTEPCPETQSILVEYKTTSPSTALLIYSPLT